jgi:hypothetical protein
MAKESLTHGSFEGTRKGKGNKEKEPRVIKKDQGDGSMNTQRPKPLIRTKLPY